VGYDGFRILAYSKRGTVRLGSREGRLWDFIHTHENDADPSAKLAQDFDESEHPRDERGRFAYRGDGRPQSKLESALLFGKVTSEFGETALVRPALACTAISSIKHLYIPGPPNTIVTGFLCFWSTLSRQLSPQRRPEM